MFESIKSLRPYFYSLREIQGNSSLELKIPTHWVFDNIITQYKLLESKIQDKNEKFTLVSLISKPTEDGYNLLHHVALEVINTNKESEEKRKLFKEKVAELEKMFLKEPLDKLKEIQILNVGNEDTTGIKMVGDSENEG